jgi:protein-S-isoprenylcysteine O-methyltransferase Ste14
MSSSQVQNLTAVGPQVCWGVLVVAWVSEALYNALRGPDCADATPARIDRFIVAVLVLAIAVRAIRRVVPRSSWEALMIHTPWVRVLGFVVLIGSTAFALWARMTLGTMWSLAPVVKDRDQLNTDGPYGVMRHPIYTGLLGMLLGTVLVVGLGRSVVILPVGVVALKIKLRVEERLLLATSSNDYPRYRGRVPELILGVRPRSRPRL